jgi:hypothetical protein
MSPAPVTAVTAVDHEIPGYPHLPIRLYRWSGVSVAALSSHLEALEAERGGVVLG